MLVLLPWVRWIAKVAKGRMIHAKFHVLQVTDFVRGAFKCPCKGRCEVHHHCVAL
jgi:hypothetical protein